MDDENIAKQMQLRAKQPPMSVTVHIPKTACCDCVFCAVSTKVETTYSCDKGCFDSNNVAPTQCTEFKPKED